VYNKRFDTVTAVFILICAGCLAVYAYFMLTVPEPISLRSPHRTYPYEFYGGGHDGIKWAVVSDMENPN